MKRVEYKGCKNCVHNPMTKHWTCTRPKRDLDGNIHFMCPEWEGRDETMKRCIDRDEAIQAILDLPDCPNGFSDTYDKARIIGVLEDLPVKYFKEPVKARWEECPGEWQTMKCSNCGGYRIGIPSMFCPHCGAKMEKLV